MEDLTSEVFTRLGTDPVTALAPSSMAGGNMISDSAKQTMTAPGSPPVDPMPEQDELGDPAITAQAYGPAVLRGPDGAPRHADNADRGNPDSAPDGHGWTSGPAPHWGPARR